MKRTVVVVLLLALIYVHLVTAANVDLSIIDSSKYLSELAQISKLEKTLWGTPLTCSALKAYKEEILRGALFQFNRTIIADYLQFAKYIMKTQELMSGRVLPPPVQVTQAKLLLGAAQAYLRAIQADVAALENVTQVFNFPYCETSATETTILKIADITKISPEEAVKLVSSLKPKINPADCYFMKRLHEILIGLKKWVATKKMQLKELETRVSVYNRVIDGIIADMYGEKTATVLQSLSDDLKVYTIIRILNASLPVLKTPTGDLWSRAFTIGQNMYSIARYGFVINAASPYAQEVEVPRECNDVFNVTKTFLVTLDMNLINRKYGGLNKLAECFGLMLRAELNVSLRNHNMSFKALKAMTLNQMTDLDNIVKAYEMLTCSR